MKNTNIFTYEKIGEVKAVYELKAISQKSFYGKACIIETAKGYKLLQSYDTIVLCISRNGKVYKTWNGYSVTTKNHINDFLFAFNKPGYNKKELENLEYIFKSVRFWEKYIQERNFKISGSPKYQNDYYCITYGY